MRYDCMGYIDWPSIIRCHWEGVLPFWGHNFFFSWASVEIHILLSIAHQHSLVGLEFEADFLATTELLSLHFLLAALKTSQLCQCIDPFLVSSNWFSGQQLIVLLAIFTHFSLTTQCGCWGWRYSVLTSGHALVSGHQCLFSLLMLNLDWHFNKFELSILYKIMH